MLHSDLFYSVSLKNASKTSTLISWVVTYGLENTDLYFDNTEPQGSDITAETCQEISKKLNLSLSKKTQEIGFKYLSKKFLKSRNSKILKYML